MRTKTALPITEPPNLAFYRKKIDEANMDYKDRPNTFTGWWEGLMIENHEKLSASNGNNLSTFHENTAAWLIRYNQDLTGGSKAPSMIATAEAGTNINNSQQMPKLFRSIFDFIDALGMETGAWPQNGQQLFQFQTANPLSELAALGHNNMVFGFKLVEFSWAGKGLSGLSGFLKDVPIIGAPFQLAGYLGGIGLVIGGVFLTIGAMLLYFLPMLPFIRFFFAVVLWLLLIFEAVVAAPLFALAHLDPYGDGMMGPSAKKGYHFLLSLLLRPILTIFGLIAGALLFAVCIIFLNKMFLIAAYGTGSYNAGFATLSKIFFSIMYVFISYICANTCFKTITHFPEHALNWMAATGPMTKDIGDPTQIAGAVAAAGDYLITKSIMQPVSQALGGVAQPKGDGRDGGGSPLRRNDGGKHIAGAIYDDNGMGGKISTTANQLPNIHAQENEIETNPAAKTTPTA